jgi:hypothetical protein
MDGIITMKANYRHTAVTEARLKHVLNETHFVVNILYPATLHVVMYRPIAR